jgi:hypothetical protein
VGKQKLSAWHTGAYKTFCGMCVTSIFFNSMCVNHSQSRCTHGSVFFFVTPSSHGLTRTENLGRRAATRSRASKLAQAQRQGKEARREGAQPRPRRRRGFHQARRQPRGKHGRHGRPDTGHRGVGVGSAGGATSTSPDAGHGPSAGVVASFSPDEQRPWKEVIPDLECPCFHRFR